MTHRDFESAIILNDMSDHMPLITLLKQTKFLNKTNLEFKSQNLNKKDIQLIKSKLCEVDWIGTLNKGGCEENFNTFTEKLNTVMDTVSPEKIVRIEHKRKFVEPWMIHGIEITSRKKIRLYKKSITLGATEADIKAYKNYRNQYNQLKHMTQQTCYREKIQNCKSRMIELWKVINTLLGKAKHKGSIISHTSVNGIKNYNPEKIANEFGEFYSTHGSNLVKQIPKGGTNIDAYLHPIPHTDASLILKPVTVPEIEKILSHLPNKTSHGHDKISNTLLKQLCPSISFPLWVIFNQSLAKGKFPSGMKIVEVIPLHKGKSFNKAVKYRPVSLLLTISKVLKKAVYVRVYRFLEKNKILYDSQYGFCNSRSCEQAISELIG